MTSNNSTLSSKTGYRYDQCFFIDDSPADFTLDYSQTYITIIVINCLACLPTIFGNILIILGIWSLPVLHTPSNILLVGLASSDLGVGLLVPPLNIARILPKLQGSPLNSWCHVQVAYTFFGVMFCGVSFLTVAAFGIDKYLALHWHLRYTTIVTTKRVVYIVLSFWVIFGAMSAVQIWSMTVYRVSVCIVVPFFLVGTSFTYYRIYRVLLRHKVQIQSQSQVSTLHRDRCERPNDASSTLNMARYRKSVTSMFLVYCLFLLCYIPYICVQVTILIASIEFDTNGSKPASDLKSLYVAVDFTETIVIINSLLNPLIYCWRMREIRHAAKVAFSILRCNNDQVHMDRSITFSQ
ncbi:beta-2 adrenergic receptor-like [Exaiptasia diaphana]|uniref:G-protein coupled receptors family 1 profile domain-containing protein n=1 Tax=Exaiptasia diaphana TaxID=2652724 RepID=A0A913XN58_EXADI|nr:beta-2 adrenergic receptor-like [Exaiptasia diaphana]